MRFRLPASLILFFPTVLFGNSGIAPSELKFFEDHIRPILAENCYKCHSEREGKQKGGLLLDRRAGWVAGGDSGESVIDFEHPEESLLIKMVQHDPDFEPMPPKSKLSEVEIERLVEWVTMGAPDPREGELAGSAAHDEFNLEERKGWWSLQPLQKVSVPEVANKEWPLNKVDRFVLNDLEKKSWTPADEADPETLLRRLSISLVGLAPTPEELNDFLKDESPDAYEKQVERLLGSPHFGERWARYWMDVVRYADSKAYETDYFIPYGSEYRDYLVRAFNDDVPFDQFVREAFAGDQLEKPRLNTKNGVNESVIGPGFWLFTDGQHGPPDLHEDEARVFDGMINTATVAFQGLTVSCAKCHDHKFDAITAADYYSLYGILRSSRLKYPNATTPGESQGQALAELEEFRPQLVKEVLKVAREQSEGLPQVIKLAVDLRDDPAIKVLLEEWKSEEKKTYKDRDYSKLTNLEKTVVDQARQQITPVLAAMAKNWFRFLWLEEDIPELNGLRLALVGERTKRKATKVPDYQRSDLFKWSMTGNGITELENADFVLDFDSPRIIRSGAEDAFVSGLQSSRLEGGVHTEDFVLDGKPINLWVRGHGASVQLIVRNYEMAGYGPTTGVLRKELHSDKLTDIRFPTKLWKGETAYLEVLHHGDQMKVYRPKDVIKPPSEGAYLVLPQQFSTDAWNNHWGNSDPNNIAGAIRSILEGVENGRAQKGYHDLVGALFIHGLLVDRPSSPAIKKLVKRGKELREQIAKPRYVRSLAEGSNYHEPVYVRGNHKQLSKEKNPKHFMDAFGGPQIGTTSSGRLEYAEHLLTTTDFLTARVRVNRIWSRLFGRGLVASVDDFGKMGELPSHPDLLDYLAGRFISEGWSTKTLIRELVTTRAFRMSSVPSESAKKLDPANVYLQRMPVQRMDAEAVRDHILLVSGRLDRTLHGPAININLDDALKSRALPLDGPLDGEGRRSIYQAMRRNFLPTFQKAFNLPDPSEPVGQRQVTNLPAQSLTLLNHPFVHQQAEVWAERVLAEPGADEERLKKLHKLAFSRTASERELAWGKKALGELRKNGDEKSAWADLCHIMINRKEFIYVF